MAVPVTPITAEAKGDIKRLGFGRSHECSLRITSEKNVFELPHGTIEVAVEVSLPRNRTLQHVELALYEDVCVDRDEGEKDGRYRQAERVLCSQTFPGAVFAPVVDVELDGNVVRATLQLQIDDPGRKAAGGAVAASLEAKYIQFRHRIAVDTSFGMGSHVAVSAPVTLVGAVPVASPVVTSDQGGSAP